MAGLGRDCHGHKSALPAPAQASRRWSGNAGSPLFAIAEVTIALATFLSHLDFQAIRPFAPRLVPALTLRPRDPVPILPRARAR